MHAATLNLPTITTPYNEEAEQALLGALLVNPKAFERVADTLRPEHFYDPVHSRIYGAIVDAAARGEVATPITLKRAFDADPDLSRDGGGDYIVQLAANMVTVFGVPEYARTIRDLYVRRCIIDAALEMVVTAATPGDDQPAERRLEEAEVALYQLGEAVDFGKASGPAKISATMEDAWAAIERAQNAVDGVSGIATGLRDLDQRLGGLQAGELYVLAGRPGMGKTAISLTMAANIARAGYSVLFFSLEMSKAQLGMRLLAQRTGISIQEQRRRLDDGQRASLRRASDYLHGLPLAVDDSAGLSAAQIRNRARRHKGRHGLDVIFIDYLGFVRPADQRANRVHQIEEITGAMKALSKELDVPVVLLSQLSRAVEQRDDKRPTMSDLRDSGSIEQDADVIMFVYRDEYYLQNGEPKQKPGQAYEKYMTELSDWQTRLQAARNVGEVIVAKFRQGESGTVRMRFDGARQLFEDLAE